MTLSRILVRIGCGLLATGLLCSAAAACTRVVYLGPGGRILTARTMDWKTDIGTNLWVFPRGIERSGMTGERTISWTSKYGSVTAAAFDVATSDGLNEAGLSANLLWLAESKYQDSTGDKPGLSIALWAQYVLDNFATVGEAVTALEAEPFVVLTDRMPGEDRSATLHLSVSDATGDSAIFEYVDGNLVIHHGREYQVMTNSPIFSEQLAISSYWEGIGGDVMLPGTSRAADRFVRARYYIDAIPKVDDRRTATASVFSVIRNVSVPFGISTPGQPNIASTRWRTVADHKERIYYFESAMTPNTFWVDLKELDLEPGSPIRALKLGPDQRETFAGEVSGAFEDAEPFTFLGVEPGVDRP